MTARGACLRHQEESGCLAGAPMSRRAERPQDSRGRGADCVKARDLVRPSEARALRERAMKKRPEGRGSQRAASVCRRPGAQHHVYAAERSVRGFLRSRSRPQRPRTGSLSTAKSAGTGQRKVPLAGGTGRSPRSGRPARPVGKEEPVQGPVPGASKRSEVAPGTGRLQRPKPEGQGGLAAKRESADGPEAHGGAPLGRTGAGEDRLRRRHEVLPRRRTQPQGRAGDGWRDACTPAQGMTAMPA